MDGRTSPTARTWISACVPTCRTVPWRWWPRLGQAITTSSAATRQDVPAGAQPADHGADHHQARTVIAVAPLLLAAETALLLRSRQEGWAGQKVAGWRWLASHRRYLRTRRNRLQGTRKVLDTELLDTPGGAHRPAAAVPACRCPLARSAWSPTIGSWSDGGWPGLRIVARDRVTVGA